MSSTFVLLYLCEAASAAAAGPSTDGFCHRGLQGRKSECPLCCCSESNAAPVVVLDERLMSEKRSNEGRIFFKESHSSLGLDADATF